MNQVLITAGKKYLDIDAYAAMLAYRQLLRALGKAEIYAVSSSRLNYSIPTRLRQTKYQLDQALPQLEADYILVDVSNPDFFDQMVDQRHIIEVIDHHTGHEAYWQARLGAGAQIEFIGSVCTIIYERIAAADKLEILDGELCQLLMAGILDNTINLQSNITTERDRRAYQELLKIGKISDDWRWQYFSECQAEIESNLVGALLDDLKIEPINQWLPATIGQLLVLDGARIDVQALRVALAEYASWLVNVISLADGRSYLYCSDNQVKRHLKQLLGVSGAEANLVRLPDFILRKQLIKRARDFFA